MQVRLTNAIARDAICPAGRQKIKIHDDMLRGFFLEVRRAGGRTYYQRYRDSRGRWRDFRIGPADHMTTTAARKIAEEVIVRVAAGDFPLNEGARRASTPTMAEFWEESYRPHVQARLRRWTSYRQIMDCYLLPALGGLRLIDITPAMLEGLMLKMSREGYSPATANKVLDVVRALFSFAIRMEVPGLTRNPANRIARLPEKPRERFLNDDELTRLQAVLESCPYKSFAAALRLMLLTGARKSEILQAKWEHVDLERRTLLIPLAKSNRSHSISLGQSAIDILRSLPRESPYLFPGRTGRPLRNIYPAWHHIREEAGLAGLRIHDLRHTFASTAINRKESLEVLQRLLGHSRLRMTQRYAHFAQNTLTEAVDRIEGYLTGTERSDAAP